MYWVLVGLGVFELESDILPSNTHLQPWCPVTYDDVCLRIDPRRWEKHHTRPSTWIREARIVFYAPQLRVSDNILFFSHHANHP